MDLVPLLTYGYCPRFGDSRDAGRTARCHSGVVGCQVKLFVVSLEFASFRNILSNVQSF